jgi:membrane-bound lytic murein transglycosylase D
MKETGSKEYGLRINSRIDERSCLHSSTEAALKYLSRAYERFGSWELALASYNCGAGNVNRAIRRAGGEKDYWAISKYLPRETRNFVPAFLGAAYIVKYHQAHGVLPAYPDLDMQLTEGVKVYTELPFETIAAAAGVPLEVVERLNPQYKRNYVPAYSEGHYVVLPRRVMQSLKDYLHLLRPDSGSTSEPPELPDLIEEDFYFPEDQYYETFYTVAMGDRLNELGKVFSCSGFNLKVWNELSSKELERGQELIVWFPKELKRFRSKNGPVEVLPLMKYAKAPSKVETLPLLPKIKAIETLAIEPLQMPEQEVPTPKVQPNTYFTPNTTKNKNRPLYKVKLWAMRRGIL